MGPFEQTAYPHLYLFKGAFFPMDYIEQLLDKLAEWVRNLLDSLLGPEVEPEPEPIPIPVEEGRKNN